jgi:hypothetical protein
MTSYRCLAVIGSATLALALVASSAVAATSLLYQGNAKRGATKEGPVTFKLVGKRIELSWEAFGCAYGGGVWMQVKNHHFKTDKTFNTGVEMAVNGTVVSPHKLIGTVHNWYHPKHCDSGTYKFTATR